MKEQLENHADVPKETIKEARFFRKPYAAEDLKQEVFPAHGSKPSPFSVEKVYILSSGEYEDFQKNMGRNDYDFLAENIDYMWHEDGFHCLLVKGTNSKDGILVESEGYAYARYAAYVPDCSQIKNLESKPMEESCLAGQEAKIWQSTAKFMRKPKEISQAISPKQSGVNNMVAEKAVILSDEEYQNFTLNMQECFEFLFDYPDDMYYDPVKKELHCLLVKSASGKDGVVVCADRFSCVDQEAYIEDCGKLQVMTQEEKHVYSYQAKKALGKTNKTKTAGDVR